MCRARNGGNIDNRALVRQFLSAMPQIVEAVAQGEAVIEFVDG
ncbi:MULTISPECIES: hypothetical protein [Bradyrhizobium]|nr:hypothetical protein [Bradyrhizobium diazoefficiens]MBP1092549.1 hypothetical protein [Bradyrhizobium japonicum]